MVRQVPYRDTNTVSYICKQSFVAPLVPTVCVAHVSAQTGNKYTKCFSSVVMVNFKIVYVREMLKIFR